MKGASEEEPEWGRFNNERVNLKVYITDLHGKLLRASERPAGVAIRSLHLHLSPGVDPCSEFSCEVGADGDNL